MTKITIPDAVAENDTLESLFAGIKAMVKRAEDERDRWGHIAATIRINALHHGATTEEAEAMVRGETNFVSWIIARVEQPRATPPDVERTIRAALEVAVKHLTRRLEALIEDHGSYEPDTGVTNLPEWVETIADETETQVALILATPTDAVLAHMEGMKK